MVASTTAFQISSPVFQPQGDIPTKYTCEGEDISPPLAWQNLPAGTQSLVLIFDDPDAPDPKAPQMTWVHWVLFNISPSVTQLTENVKKLPAGTREGSNDWKRTGYGGPCPPIGKHRYFFKLIALDVELGLKPGATKSAIEQAMAGHVLAKAELIGLYQKKK